MTPSMLTVLDPEGAVDPARDPGLDPAKLVRIYEHMLLCIATIGLVGFALDRLMNVAEMRLRAA